ncbi:hypothetical protein HanHA300_Chr01g0009381 [Helianthus annuus]|nr:hypothetical protein HanHA300_Chr01g0009381 [Helianthus annuus]
MKMAGAVRTGGKGSMRRYGCNDNNNNKNNNNRIITVCLISFIKTKLKKQHNSLYMDVKVRFRVKCHFRPIGLGHFVCLIQRFHFSHVV